MVNSFKKLFCSRNLLRYLSIFLCCLLLVFGCQLLKPLEAEAVAVVDDAVIVIIIALLASFGITFVTAESANNMATTWYNSMTPDILAPIRDIIDGGMFVLGAAWCLIEFTASEWHKLWSSFCSTFPQYANLGHQTLNFSADVQQQIMSAGLYGYLTAGNILELGELPVGVDVDVTFQASTSSILRYCGKEIIDTSYSFLVNDVYLQNSLSNNAQYILSSLPSLELVSLSRFSEHSGVVYPGSNLFYRDINGDGSLYDIGYNLYGLSNTLSNSLNLSANVFFKEERVSLSLNEYGRWSLVTPTYGNLIAYWVSTGAIPQSSPLINCDDWTYKGEIDGLLLGKDVFDVGLDIEHAPSIDGYPSQIGDASDVDSYPDTIPLNVPTSITDDSVGDLTADKVRDTTNTDVNPGDETGTDKTPPKIPHTTIPEILFKDKFPFCLPWDIYNLFVVFEDEAEAPRFEIPFKDEELGIDETYVIDFSQFDNIAAIIRFFIGAGFVLALIMISRKLTGSE